MGSLRAGLASLVIVALSGCFDPTTDRLDAGGLLADTLSISPAVVTLPLGTEAPLTLTLTPAAGPARDVTAEAQWSVEPAGLVTVQGGRVRAVAAGQATVFGKLGEQKAHALITVPAATVESLALDPSTGDTAVGGTIALSAVATMSDQSRLDLTASATFAVEPASVASVQGGVFKALAPGKATVTATVAGKTASASFTVRDAKLLALTVKPQAVTVPLNGIAQLSAEGTYDDGLTADLTLAATWSSSASAVEVDATGRATGKAAGAADITATFQGFTAQATVSVTAATLTALTVSPAQLALPVGGQGQLKVEGRFSDGSTADFTEQAIWSSSVPAAIAVSNQAGTRGQVAALGAGSAQVIARFGAITSAATVTATQSVLSSIALTPSPATLVEEQTLQFTARGTYSDGSVADVTSLASFSSLSGAILNITPSGKATGVTPGTTQVMAVLGGVVAQATVTVTANPVLYVAVLPGTVNVQAGGTFQLRAMARRADNTLREVTGLSTWTTSDATRATVSNAAGERGLLRGVANGTTQAEATFQGLKGAATVTISAPTVVAMSVNPPSMRLPVGFQFISASLAMSDGTTQEVGGTATWSSSNSQVAEVVVYDGYAYVEARMPGSAVLTATSGAHTANCQLTVTTATLTQIQISPATPQLQLGATQRLVATGVYSDFSTINLTYYATWSSSTPAVAGVDNSEFSYDRGQVTALSVGTTTISVNFQGVTSTTSLTVSPATLTRIQVAPFAPRIPVGFDTWMRATGIYSDNTTRDLSYDVAWTSSAPGTASVDPYGRMTPHQAGTATLRATFGGVTGSTDVTITNATLQSIAITPGSVSLAPQAEQLLHAMGTFSDGTTLEVTWYVTWLSSQPSVADVRNDYPYYGQLKGLTAGSTAVTAVRGGVQASVNVTVQ